MSVYKKIFPVIACASILGACAQQEEMAAPIMAEPIYDKFGGVAGCSDGSTPSRGSSTPGTASTSTAAPTNPCMPPPDEGGCVEDSSTSTLECPPPGRGDDTIDREPDPSDSTDPTGAGTTG